MSWYDGISGTVGLIYLGVALVMWTIGGRMYPTLILCFVITGVAGIMSTPVGVWIRNGWAWITKTVGGTVGDITGIVVVVVVVVVIGFIIFINLLGQFHSPLLKHLPGNEGNPQGIDGRTIGFGALFAATASTLPGDWGAVAAYVLGALVHVVAWPVTAGLGY